MINAIAQENMEEFNLSEKVSGVNVNYKVRFDRSESVIRKGCYDIGSADDFEESVLGLVDVRDLMCDSSIDFSSNMVFEID